MNLSELQVLNIISTVAEVHTGNMIDAGKVSHDNFPQRVETLKNNADAKNVGENVAYGFATARGVAKGWLNSPEHKKIIEH